MTLPREDEAFQNPPAPYVPTQADQDAATALFAESADQYPADYGDWLDSLYGPSIEELDPIAAEIAYDAQLALEFEWARRRRAANPTNDELATVASHGTV
jgi:hypothetical protein